MVKTVKICFYFELLVLALLAGILHLQSLAAAPVVSNIHASQRAGTGMVDIYYDLVSANNSLTVSLAVSTNGGVAFNAPAVSLTGDIGSGVAPAIGKHVVWNSGVDLAALYFPNVKVRMIADDGSQSPPASMVLIPAGSFVMGDSMGDSGTNSDELPVHTVYVSAFYMDVYDVTLSRWQKVYSWAITHGYNFDHPGSGKAANHPVQTIDWYDCVKWCNARSEMDGRPPAYYTNAAQNTVYRSGNLDIGNDCVNWNSGYRLPTEAEWEKAARGGLNGQRFPWGNTISWTWANYYTYWTYPTLPLYSYDLNPTNGLDPTFNYGDYPDTSPVGFFPPNGYGLYDMAGNVWQWCWDWYGPYSSTPQSDPRGPVVGQYGQRTYGGGAYNDSAYSVRTASRNDAAGWFSNAGLGEQGNGFRSVLSSGQ